MPKAKEIYLTQEGLDELKKELDHLKFEKRPEGGFAIVFEEDGSGDLNRVMDDLCEKHRGDSSRQSAGEIFTEIAEAVGDKKLNKGNYGNCEK